MRFFSKNTQTFIASWISTILFVIYPNITQSQEVFAIYDPLSVPNNKFGIHIIQATPYESSPAASLVNTNGDWGYITFLIQSNDRNQNKWQEFFNDLRRRHLIPIVRLATKPVNEHWERPYEKEYEAWADFLNSLIWPTKNRYVVIYNEPNHGKEWALEANPVSYAHVLDSTIDALKKKSDDFFVLNAGFDQVAPHKPPEYFDEEKFLEEMNNTIPGIFNKLDGWVSHSYPNPGFVGSPTASGRGTVRGYIWELQQLKRFGVTKTLSVFITETGWKHAEGINYDYRLPSSDVVSNYFKQAFNETWSSSRIVAVTPFLLSYQEFPFDHFSFKKVNNSGYYQQYQTIMDMPKVSGKPIQENKAQLIKGEIFSSIVAGENYDIFLTFKNTGQSIWGDGQAVKLVPIQGGRELGMETQQMIKNTKIEPGKEYTFNIKIKAPLSGRFKVILNLFNGDRQFDSLPLEFTTEVKAPVILQVKSALKWKKSAKGEYLLRIEGAVGESVQKVYISDAGQSEEIEARFLLPEYTFDFTLEKPFYKPTTVRQKVSSGINTLDFGILSLDILSALLNPKEIWNLLPFSK